MLATEARQSLVLDVVLLVDAGFFVSAQQRTALSHMQKQQLQEQHQTTASTATTAAHARKYLSDDCQSGVSLCAVAVDVAVLALPFALSWRSLVSSVLRV